MCTLIPPALLKQLVLANYLEIKTQNLIITILKLLKLEMLIHQVTAQFQLKITSHQVTPQSEWNFTFCKSIFVNNSICHFNTKLKKKSIITHRWKEAGVLKGMEYVPNMFMSFDKYLFLEVINILI